MWALGVTGTYLGDYFGILMDAPVTGFPFNVTGSPMYWGSTLNFLGVALYNGKVAGILLTAQVFVLYWFALKWEEYVLSFHADIFRSKLTTICPAPSLPRSMPSVSVSALRRLAARSSKLLNVIASLSGTFNIHNSLDKFRISTEVERQDNKTPYHHANPGPDKLFRTGRWHIWPAYECLQIRIFNEAGRVDDKPHIGHGAEITHGRASATAARPWPSCWTSAPPSLITFPLRDYKKNYLHPMRPVYHTSATLLLVNMSQLLCPYYTISNVVCWRASRVSASN